VLSHETSPQALNGHYEIREYTPNTVVMTTRTEQEGFLHFLDNYDPFWFAAIDGKQVDIHRSNFTFKAIELPAGEHLVTWKYNPYPIKLAYGVFYVILLSCLLLLGYRLMKRRPAK
jgi:uncharacterized membrane protein YfhO